MGKKFINLYIYRYINFNQNKLHNFIFFTIKLKNEKYYSLLTINYTTVSSQKLIIYIIFSTYLQYKI